MAKINVYQRELYHHGILGQKWGRKMGPPYPLGAGDHSAAEKKEGYKKSLGGGRNESLYDRNSIKSNKDAKKFVKELNKSGKSGYMKERQYTDKEVVSAVSKRFNNTDFSSVREKEKKLLDFNKANKDKIVELENKFYDEAVDENNLSSKVKEIAKKNGIKPSEIEDNIEWLEQEAYNDLLNEADVKFENTELGKKQKELLDAADTEYTKIGKSLVKEYGDISLDNVYAYVDGKKRRATIEQAVVFALREIDRKDSINFIKEHGRS